jgi:septal ring factor EnvC (AmiA/AmiB activator)
MIAAVLGVLLLAQTLGSAGDGPSTKGAASIPQRLDKERAAARQLAGREAGLLGRLAEQERQVEIESRAVRAAQQRLRTATTRLADSDAKSAAAGAQLAQATFALGPRLTARYRLGREGYLRFLLGARSIGEVLRRKRLFNALLEADLDALAVLRFAADGAKAARDELAASRLELALSAQAESDRRAALEVKVVQQKRMLVSVQQERAVHEQAVRELEEAARALSGKLSDLGKSSAPVEAVRKPDVDQTPVRKARGKLVFPVERGRVEVRFGRTLDPHFGTVTLQRGLDIRAPQGTPVHAVWPGKVVHAGWFKGYGNLLIVDHGDGIFSLAAHLDALEKAVGDEVAAGDEVGTVGDTGSLKGPYLYFELRDGQKPLDPERWLSRVRKPASLVAAGKGAKAP